jgi:acyl-CoA synthetase (AMP-forming)/AMP-acid ligase II
MQGYLDQPDATAAALVEDGWLRTGDIAHVDRDGYFYVVDRLKELIKYNAYQVAPAPLEALLVSHPAIADAAVIPSPDAGCGEVPKAVVVLKTPISPDDIMAFVAERDAPYEKIRRVEIVDAIPKSASGKILRRILVERERNRPSPDGPPPRPTSPGG